MHSSINQKEAPKRTKTGFNSRYQQTKLGLG